MNTPDAKSLIQLMLRWRDQIIKSEAIANATEDQGTSLLETHCAFQLGICIEGLAEEMGIKIPMIEDGDIEKVDTEKLPDVLYSALHSPVTLCSHP